MSVVETVRSVAGDSLRSVAEYRESEFELYYVRGDVEEKDLDLEKIHQNLVLDGIGREFLEDLFDAGDLQCTIHQFDEALACHFAFPHNRGLFVSIDADGDVPLRELVDRCEGWYESGHEGSAFD